MPSKWSEDKQAYQKEYHKKWYAENKSRESLRIKKRKQDLAKWFSEYKAKLKCSKCAENHQSCLDFHHMRDKEDCVYKMVIDGCGKERILKEIDKCVVLCSNCHRKLHYENNVSP